MSAYIVGPDTIVRVLQAVSHACDASGVGTWSGVFWRERFKTFDPGNPSALARQLWRMNFAAVEVRYGKGNPDSTPEEEARAQATIFPREVNRCDTDTMQLIKSLSCYLYQCSEGEVDQWELYKNLDLLRGHLALGLIREMPKYETAMWG